MFTLSSLKSRLLLVAAICLLSAVLSGYWCASEVRASRVQAGQVAASRLESAKAYLHIQQGRPLWFYDRFNPSELASVERAKQVFTLTDPAGNLIESSSRLENVKYVVARGTIGDGYRLSVGAEVEPPHLAFPLAVLGLTLISMALCVTWAVRSPE